MAYYCTECDKMHRRLSGIGVRHKEFEGEKPTRITVKPDRSGEGYTGISVLGDEIETWTGSNTDTFTLEIDPWKGTVPPWDADEPDSATPQTFTEALIDALESHIRTFHQIPWTHTPQELSRVRLEQTKWLGALKALIAME